MPFIKCCLVRKGNFLNMELTPVAVLSPLWQQGQDKPAAWEAQQPHQRVGDETTGRLPANCHLADLQVHI